MASPFPLETSLDKSASRAPGTHPEKSAWVAASAGTGKTKILTDRVLSLLLSGVPLEKILCLTFTKAGATEMMDRVMTRLSAWAIMAPQDLETELAPLGGATPFHLARARTLFAELLDHPTGLTLQTLHSFCQSLLQRFPMEAGLSCAFSIADESTALDLLTQAQQDTLSSPCPQIQKALVFLASSFGQERFQDLFESLFQSRQQEYMPLTDDPVQVLLQTFGVNPQESPQNVLNSSLNHAALQERLSPFLTFLETGGKEDQERARLLKAYLEKETPNVSDFLSAAKTFLTQEGDVRARLVSKALASARPDCLAALQDLARQIKNTRDLLQCLHIAQHSLSFFQLYQEVTERYQTLKSDLNRLDYDDLIEKACLLLHDPAVCDWVRYKMDGGIDHILVDEAQDTNDRQWALVSALTEEFFSGDGAKARPTTLFAVGDVKQSIYRFQGAMPALFEDMRTHFSARAERASHDWEDVSLNKSYRSSSAVLALVDHLIDQTPAYAGVRSLESRPLPHLCAKPLPGGQVCLWPLAPKAEDEARVPEQELAKEIAATIRQWLNEGRILESTGAPLEPQDIMVLIQRRHAFVGHLTRALREQGVPVAGEDRIILENHLAVQDLVAFGRFLLLPQDDWSLGCCLKSPLGGLDDQELESLCLGRQGTLWQALCVRAQETPFHEPHALLSDMLRKVDQISVFSLYGEVLYTRGYFKHFVARFGDSVQEILYEFLMLSKKDEQTHGSCLEGFLDRLSKTQNILKKDFANNTLNQVRILTVHGAKGLQAPLVILADTTTAPTLKESFMWHRGVCIWLPPRDQEPPLVRDLKKTPLGSLAEDGHRLLYVALTRAQDEIHVWGWENARGVSEKSWYRLVEESLLKIGSLKEDGPLVLSHRDPALRVPRSSLATHIDPSLSQDKESASWLFKPLPRESDALTSQAQAVTEQKHDMMHAPQSARLRGTVLHTLLEWLPRLSIAERSSTLESYLDTYDDTLLPSLEKETIRENVDALLTHPDLQKFFGVRALHEVPLSGFLEGNPVTGRIDLLLQDGKDLLIVDFKSTPAPPLTIPAAYVEQLRLYQRLLQPLYPHHKITTWILWTSTATLVKVHEASPQEIAA
ncbi:MAG: double-strand break repair helicase AddA [Alphaproteobacteria bacterium]|jgi:ATP-dependent helicase/nuclease subunit A|nr:double-strand break repair helicase AddA [Alphaproteobacteria bacterium]